MKTIQSIHNLRKDDSTRTFFIFDDGSVEIQCGIYKKLDGHYCLDTSSVPYRMPKQNARILYGNKIAQGWEKVGKLERTYPIGGDRVYKVVRGRKCVKTNHGYVGIE